MKYATYLLLLVSASAAAWQQPYTIQETYNPMKSYTVTPPTYSGGQTTIRNTYDPMESYTVTPPTYSGGQTTIRDTYNPMKSWTINR